MKGCRRHVFVCSASQPYLDSVSTFCRAADLEPKLVCMLQGIESKALTHLVSFALLMTSSKVLNLMMDCTGPKISCKNKDMHFNEQVLTDLPHNNVIEDLPFIIQVT